ncbi:hypothetical protein GQ55_8G194100 [Panicum hallii var. hallii]|uniref:Uncharacterized protein n=1 Tax=Panicum hallii var. hallii TaxID=1504633 RepID=A0A2T7CP58_9POAL|nr:hypothetical protein GQ55_8G194100 [Panicum hallii var. hallii]
MDDDEESGGGTTRPPEEMKGSCGSWIVEMEELGFKADTPGDTAAACCQQKPSIYRVPEWIQGHTNRSAYRPRLVSFGPFHHGAPDLVPMEEHKLQTVLHLVKRSGKPLAEFTASIDEVVEELLGAYDKLDGRWRGESRGRFVQMMVMDGRFLLEFMQSSRDYAPNNPIFCYHGHLTMWSDIRSDMVVMENQLVLLVLQRLVAVRDDRDPSAAQINNMVLGLLGSEYKTNDFESLGLHPLDMLQRSLCGPPLFHVPGEWEGTMPPAAELSEAGIHFKVSKTHFIHDIDFEDGVLSMPPFEAHDDTEKNLLNLLAFEKLHPGTRYEVLSYLFFMDNMINTERDVALLRSKELVENLLSSDEELAKLVNSLGSGSLMNPSSKLNDVQRMVKAHCKKPWNRWRASFVHKYLSNPWVFISLMAAFFLLVTTVLFYTKS